MSQETGPQEPTYHNPEELNFHVREYKATSDFKLCYHPVPHTTFTLYALSHTFISTQTTPDMYYNILAKEKVRYSWYFI